MKKPLILLAIVLLSACQQQETQTQTQTQNTEAPKLQEVNLYSARQEALMKPLLDAFTAQTGIKVNMISSKADALLTRIQSEGENSPADVLLTTDAGRLYRAKLANIFTQVDSVALTQEIPSQYRDPDGQWFGLSVRARPIMLTNQAPQIEIKQYEDLANPQLTKQICIRSSGNIYNQSLVASAIEANNETITEAWAKGLVANFARSPQGGDRDQIRAAAAGQCSIVVANTYYLANMLSNPSKTDDYQAASTIKVIWPNQEGRGTHVNVSGAGVLKTAPNAENAIKLIEFLASDTAQALYAKVNFEYPVKSGIELHPILQAWGEFKADSLPLSILGENNARAVQLMDRAGWK